FVGAFIGSSACPVTLSLFFLVIHWYTNHFGRLALKPPLYILTCSADADGGLRASRPTEYDEALRCKPEGFCIAS
ncbi:MAG: hypothetical protein MR636_09845, partial [Clostridiales bacterium]|nr:hypothetical protein [Clostridiales bacterium]